MLQQTDKTDLSALGLKSSELATQIDKAMDNLGVTRIANVYRTQTYSSTHGTQYYLHIDGDDNNSDLFRSTISSNQETHYDYGDFNLTCLYPDLDTVLEFLASIGDINDAITEIKEKIELATKLKTNVIS